MKIPGVYILVSMSLLWLASCSGELQPVIGQDIVKNFPGTPKQEYVPGTEDIPLYHGFHANDEGNVLYDSADGRIVDATFFSRTAPAHKVRQFYEATLPQLGWSKRQYDVYERDGEILKIDILRKQDRTVLKMVIKPSLS